MTAHCKLCSHSRFDSKSGTLCGITKLKPHFSGLCPNYLEDEEAQFFIKKLRKELTDPRLKKSNLITTVVLRGTIGLLLIFGTYQFWAYLNTKIDTGRLITSGKLVTVVIIGYFLGAIIITSGIATYRHFTNKRKYAEYNLNKHIGIFQNYREKAKSAAVKF